MKRSEKEAEVRKLLETPGAKMLLPELAYKFGDEYSSIVRRLVDSHTPEGGWEPEIAKNTHSKPQRAVATADLPKRLRAETGIYGPILQDETGRTCPMQGYEAAADAYNAMKEAEEAESDPNDPITAGLQKLAEEEIAVLVRDAAIVTREETIRQLAARYRSKFTREEFVELEMKMALGCQETDTEDIDPEVLTAIRRRAEWNARAAERAGVVWRHQDSKVQEQFTAGFDHGYKVGWRARMDTLNPVCSPEAVDEVLAAEAAIEQETGTLQSCPFCGSNDLTENRQERYGNSHVGWLSMLCQNCGARGPEVKEGYGISAEAREREVAEVKSRWNSRRSIASGDEAATSDAIHEDELQQLVHATARQHDRINGIEDRLDQHKASIATIAEGQTRIELESRERDSGLDRDRRVLAGSVQKLQSRVAKLDVAIDRTNENLMQRVVVLEADNVTNKDALRGLRDLGQRTFDRLESLEESIDGAHGRLQKHDSRITKSEEQIRTFIQPASGSKKGD